jgi:haloacid dehalogenase-like hydrolase
MNTPRKVVWALLTVSLALAVVQAAMAADEPMPSWQDGPAKRAIMDFVVRVTSRSGPDFVPESERIATFDNDGTLWAEQPMYIQMAFVLDRVKTLAPQHPEWKEKQPFKAVLEGDLKALAASGEKGLIELGMATHAGMTTQEFEQIVKDWLTVAKHPRFARPYTECIYQPMVELLAYLRATARTARRNHRTRHREDSRTKSAPTSRGLQICWERLQRSRIIRAEPRHVAHDSRETEAPKPLVLKRLLGFRIIGALMAQAWEPRPAMVPGILIPSLS